MKRQWLKYLCDPSDRTPLEIHKVAESEKDDIISGALRSKSGNFYEIKNGTPVLLTKNSQSIKSVDSFRYEWEQFDFDYGKGGWLKDVVRPVVGGLTFFKNKVVIDCGAGSGRQSRWIAEAGAKFIFCIELSNSAHSVIKKVTKGYKDKVFIIQADISQIPIDPNKIDIDVIYCTNVIQHTRNSAKTLVELSKLMNKKSRMMFNIYLARGKRTILFVLKFLRIVVKRLPFVLLKLLSFVLAIICLPFNRFMRFGRSFKEIWLNFYDILGSHEYQEFYTEEHLADILENANLRIIKRSRYVFLLKRRI